MLSLFVLVEGEKELIILYLVLGMLFSTAFIMLLRRSCVILLSSCVVILFVFGICIRLRSCLKPSQLALLKLYLGSEGMAIRSFVVN